MSSIEVREELSIDEMLQVVETATDTIKKQQRELEQERALVKLYEAQISRVREHLTRVEKHLTDGNDQVALQILRHLLSLDYSRQVPLFPEEVPTVIE